MLTPQFVETTDVDFWLDVIAAGRGAGVTAEATAHHRPRPGVAYRFVRDGPRVPVRLLWWRDNPPTALRTLVDDITALHTAA